MGGKQKIKTIKKQNKMTDHMKTKQTKLHVYLKQPTHAKVDVLGSELILVFFHSVFA